MKIRPCDVDIVFKLLEKNNSLLNELNSKVSHQKKTIQKKCINCKNGIFKNKDGHMFQCDVCNGNTVTTEQYTDIELVNKNLQEIISILKGQ